MNNEIGSGLQWMAETEQEIIGFYYAILLLLCIFICFKGYMGNIIECSKKKIVFILISFQFSEHVYRIDNDIIIFLFYLTLIFFITGN
jgi:hypothetical protein